MNILNSLNKALFHHKTTTNNSSPNISSSSTETDNIEDDQHWSLENISIHCIPQEATCACFDPVQRIIAVGTRLGLIHIYGYPGVDRTFYCQPGFEIKLLEIAINEGLLLSVCEKQDVQVLYVWDLQQQVLRHTCSFLEDKIIALEIPLGSKFAYLGMKSGGVRMFQFIDGYLALFKIQPSSRGAVMAIDSSPVSDNLVVLGFQNGDCVIFDFLDLESPSSEYTLKLKDCQVNSVSWHPKQDAFIAAYSNGDLVVWKKGTKQPLQVYKEFSNTGTITDVYWIKTGIFVNFVKEEKVETSTETKQQQEQATNEQVKQTPDQQTGQSPTQQTPQKSEEQTQQSTSSESAKTSAPGKQSGLYQIFIKKTLNNIELREICNIETKDFILLPTDSPYKTIKFGAIVTADGRLKVVDITIPSSRQNGNTITNIGSFHHQGMANIVEAHLLEKMNLVVPSKPANPKSEWPLTGGVRFYRPGLISSFLFTRQEDGSGDVWEISEDIGSVSHACGLHLSTVKDKICRIVPWSKKVVVIAYESDTIQFLQSRTLKQFPLLNAVKQEIQQKDTTKEEQKTQEATQQPTTEKTPETVPTEEQQKVQEQEKAETSQEAQSPDVKNQTQQSGQEPTPQSPTKQEQKKSVQPTQQISGFRTLPLIPKQKQVHQKTKSTPPTMRTMSLSQTPKPLPPIPKKSPSTPTAESQAETASGPRKVTALCPIPAFNKLAVGYSDGLLKISNIAQGYDLVTHSVQLEESISSLEVAIIEKDTWVIFAGGEKTGKISCVELHTGNILGVFNPKHTKTKCISLFAIDEKGNRSVRSDNDETPPFIAKEVKESFYPIKINQKQKDSIGVNVCYLDPQLKLYNPLVMELNLTSELGLLSGNLTIGVYASNGDALFWYKIHPLSVQVGHVAKDKSDVFVDFSFKLEAPLSTSTIVIVHDIQDKRYKIYSGSDLVGISTYEKEILSDCSMASVTASIDVVPEGYNSAEQYMRCLISDINFYYKTRTKIANLRVGSRPDVRCTWSNASRSVTKYLITCQDTAIKARKFPGYKRMHVKEFKKVKIVSAQDCYNYGKHVLICLDNTGVVRAFSLPQLSLLMKQSLLQPHLLRGVSPSNLVMYSDTGCFVAVARDTLLQGVILNKSDVFEVWNSQLHVPSLQIPPKSTGFFSTLFSTPTIFSHKVESLFAMRDSTSDRIAEIISSKLQRNSGNIDKRIIRPTRDQPLQTLKQKSHEKKPVTKQPENEEASRKELFGDLEDSKSEKPSPGKTGKATTGAVGSSIQQTSQIMKENTQKLHERGEKLSALQIKFQQMEENARNFAEKARQLREKQSKGFFGQLFDL